MNQAFIPKWKQELPATFHFEELLVWLYGFSGFPDAVNSWQDLFADYKQRVLNGINFDACFQDRFHVNNGVPWPVNFLQQRPNNPDLIAVLLPSILAAPVLPAINQIGKDLTHSFTEEAVDSEVQLKEELTLRFVDCILTKPFVILTGLAGSGKTKIAQAFTRWITLDPGFIDPVDKSKGKKPNPQYALIPVGADWTGNENIVGYPNGLSEKNYVTKPALELILHAHEHKDTPHFLILDEMNLSHVERYFADLLSAIESGEGLDLYPGDISKPETWSKSASGKPVPPKLEKLPDNLFIIGTVNVDETTYMFSPKVLDRANVIEFRMEADELAAFLTSPKKPNLDELDGGGAAYAKDFVAAAADKSREVPATVKADYEREMLLFFKLLRAHSAEFGYRTGYESARFVHFYKLLGGFADDDKTWFNSAMDCVIVQKFLPKLHGSRSKMEGLLWALAWACGAKQGGDFLKDCLEAGKAQDEGKFSPEKVLADLGGVKARYPLSFEKVMRMWEKLKRDQFVSFAEA